MNRRIIAAIIASLGVAGPLTSAVRAQGDDVRREDRRADQQRLQIPRNADGTINVDQLAAEIRQAFQNGARDVRIREAGLNAQERQQLADLAQQLATQLGVQRVRVREDDNRLRIELRDQRVARDNDRDRRPDRVARVERPDRNDRVERPERNDRVERPERIERAERPEHPERVERPERAERPDRPDRSGRH